MIQLNLTLQEACFLRTSLSDLPQDAISDDIQHILHKLDLAQQSATSTQQCPVCRRSFTQFTNGRTGHYCSNACKQKAYRQRRLDAIRRIPPRFLSDS